MMFALCVAMSALWGCVSAADWNYRITGEARLYQIDQAGATFPVAGCGNLHPAHDTTVSVNVMAPSDADLRPGPAARYYYTAGEPVSAEQSICIILNRCFVKHLEDAGQGEVLAYVEVEDGSGTKPIRNVFFRDDFQPAGALLNFQDRIIYGPTTFKGKPITIRFYVYELDRRENEAAAVVVEALAGKAKTLGGPYGLLADLVGEIVKTLIRTNVDDREFFHEITLFPVHPGAEHDARNVAVLRTGQFVIVKKELARHVSPDAL